MLILSFVEIYLFIFPLRSLNILSFDNFSTTFSHVFIVSFGTAQTKHTSPFWIWLTIDWLTSTEDELTRCILINKKTSSHELNFVD